MIQTTEAAPRHGPNPLLLHELNQRTLAAFWTEIGCLLRTIQSSHSQNRLVVRDRSLHVRHLKSDMIYAGIVGEPESGWGDADMGHFSLEERDKSI